MLNPMQHMKRYAAIDNFPVGINTFILWFFHPVYLFSIFFFFQIVLSNNLQCVNVEWCYYSTVSYHALFCFIVIPLKIKLQLIIMQLWIIFSNIQLQKKKFNNKHIQYFYSLSFSVKVIQGKLNWVFHLIVFYRNVSFCSVKSDRKFITDNSFFTTRVKLFNGSKQYNFIMWTTVSTWKILWKSIEKLTNTPTSHSNANNNKIPNSKYHLMHSDSEKKYRFFHPRKRK